MFLITSGIKYQVMITGYRTSEQFKEICENAYNGNWSDAFDNCVEYGFYANDLIRHFEQDEYCGIEAADLAILAEGASNRR